MKLTNIYGIREVIARAIERENAKYDKGDADFSVSMLMSPPQILKLKRENAGRLVEDVSEGIWRLLGHLMHILMESGDPVNALTEERLYATMYADNPDENGLPNSLERDYVISGKPDVYHGSEKMIEDYKFTSVWSIIYDSRRAEWERSANIYAYIFERNGFPVKSLLYTCILKDWKPRDAKAALAKGDTKYPQIPIVSIELPLWPKEKTEALIEERLALHQRAKTVQPVCTDEDVWATRDKFAVMKEGNKKATAVFDSETEAHRIANIKIKEASEDKKKKNQKFYVQLRPAEWKRCGEYCPVEEFCPQWKEKRLRDEWGDKDNEVA